MRVRILALSDEVVPRLQQMDFASLEQPIDVLIGCGDLPYTYMEHIVTIVQTPHALYVHGNHDTPQQLSSGRTLHYPGGWENVDGRVAHGAGLLVAGLEGSIRYRPHAPYQYTERQMRWRALRLLPRLFLNRVLHGRYLDVFIAHSPARDVQDGEGAHRGFQVFINLIRTFRPRLFLHGHKHLYGPGARRMRYQDTIVVNVHPFQVIDFTDTKIELRSLRGAQTAVMQDA